jgi:hypothetical protein
LMVAGRQALIAAGAIIVEGGRVPNSLLFA